MSAADAFRLPAAAGASLALALAGTLAPTGGAAAATSSPPPPRIVDVRYIENTSGDGRRHHIRVIAKGEPVGIAGKVNGVRAEAVFVRGRAAAKKQVAFFRSRRFVKAFRADIADGVAILKVWAANEGGVTRKRCVMRLRTDRLYGDYAKGRCRRF